MASDRIYGIHPVREALESGKKLERILLRQGMEGPVCNNLLELAQSQSVPVQYVPQEKLNYLAKGNAHQGVVALLAALDYVSLEDAVAAALASGPSPIVVLLDGVSDVRNFGAIARTCECAGVGALFVPAKGGAAVNQDAIKTSAGALMRLPVCKVPNLRTALYFLKESGFTVIGATEKTDTRLYDVDFKRPVALVMGSEGQGISSAVWPLCDERVAIPMKGSLASLNVGAATAIVLFEAVRQKSL